MTDDEPRRIEAQIEQDRASLQQALGRLRARILPDAMMREGTGFLHKSALASARIAGSAARNNPLATALIGAGLVWMSVSRRKARQAQAEAAPPLPDWLREAESLKSRADTMQDDIDRLAREAGVALEDIETGRSELREALQSDLDRVLTRGLEHLEPAERAAAIQVRKARLNSHLGIEGEGTGWTSGKTALGGAVLAGAAAALTAFIGQRAAAAEARDSEIRAQAQADAQARTDALLRELQDNLERARRDLADASARLAEKDANRR